MTTHKVDLSIELASGNPLGSVVVGIPEEQFLELNAKFPPRGFAGQNPKVNEAIKDSITEEEKNQIAEHLGIRHTHFTFEFKAACRFIDEAKEKPSFESNGKKFWVHDHQPPSNPYFDNKSVGKGLFRTISISNMETFHLKTCVG